MHRGSIGEKLTKCNVFIYFRIWEENIYGKPTWNSMLVFYIMYIILVMSFTVFFSLNDL